MIAIGCVKGVVTTNLGPPYAYVRVSDEESMAYLRGRLAEQSRSAPAVLEYVIWVDAYQHCPAALARERRPL